MYWTIINSTWSQFQNSHYTINNVGHCTGKWNDVILSPHCLWHCYTYVHVGISYFGEGWVYPIHPAIRQTYHGYQNTCMYLPYAPPLYKENLGPNSGYSWNSTCISKRPAYKRPLLYNPLIVYILTSIWLCNYRCKKSVVNMYILSWEHIFK